MEGQQTLGAADHLLARHGAAVRFQPGAPVAGQLVVQVARLGMAFIAQHQVGFQRVVGVGHIRRRDVLVGLAGLGRGRGLGRFRRLCVLRPCIRVERGGIRIHLGQHGFQRGGHRLHHHRAHAGEVFVAQFALDLLALVQAEGQRPGLVLLVLVELLDAVLQDVQRFQARLQIDALVLHAHHLVEVGLDVRHQLAVAHVGPAPAAQGRAEGDGGGEKGGVLQARAGRIRIGLDQLAVGENHLAEQLEQEVAAALALLRFAAALFAQFEVEAAGHALRGQVLHRTFLQRAGEVKAAKHRFELVGVFLEQGR